MMRILGLFAAILAFVAQGAETAAQPAFQKDIVYGKAGNVELKLDLAIPEKGDGPFPFIVCIHGGAWRAGSKSGHDGTIKAFAQHGYVAATVEYRFCPEYRFPAQVEDVKCAVRFLRAHAKEFKINPAKAGAYGESAGGHLSLMLGLMDSKDGLEGDSGSPGESSKVQAVVNYFGPTDFRLGGINPVGMALVSDFLGTADFKSDAVTKSSPCYYIDKNDPPILTFHGAADPLVPVDQAKHLHEELKKAGVIEKLEIFEGAGHGFQGKDSQRAAHDSLEFFDEYLKGKK